MEKAKILIVEDEAIIAMKIESQLQSLGYEVTSIVDTGEKVIQKAEEDKPDLILMDIRIKGGMDGIDTANEIRNRFGIPVVFTTAYLDEERIERAKIAMPFGYIIKPVHEKDLKVTIEMALYVTKIENKRKHEENIRKAQIRIIEYAVNHNIDELLQKILDEAELLTGSKIGFFHFVEEDQETLSLQVWSTNTRQNICEVIDFDRHYPISEAGVWVDCVRERKSIIHNDYKSLTHKGELPQGHVPLIRELVVPVFRNEKIRAIFGVGNKGYDYNEIDIETVKYLGNLAWETIVRKKAEEKLQENENRYRNLVENSFQGMVIFQNDPLRLSFVSKPMESICGFSPEELINFKSNELIELIHPDERGRFLTSFTDKLTGKKNDLLAEYRLIHKDKSVRYVELYSTRILYKDSVAIQAVFNDITERKLAEEALKVRKVKYRTLANNLNVGVYRNTVEGKGSFIEANPAIVKMFGYESKKEFLQSTVSRSYRDPHERKVFTKKLIEVGEVKNEELKLQRKDGTPFIASISAVAVRDPGGKIRFFDGIVEDITERKTAEIKQKRLEHRLTTFIELTPMGVIEFDGEFNITSWNPAAEKIFGYAANEAIGRNTFDILVPGYEKKKVEKIHLWDTEETTENINDNKTKDGRIITCQWFNTPIYDEANNIIGLTATCQDITDRLKAEDQLKTSEAQYRTLVSSMSDKIFLLSEDDRFVNAYFGEGTDHYFHPDQLMGKRLQETMPSHISELYSKSVGELRTTGITQSFEYPLKVKGKERWFRATLDLHENKKNIVASIRNITDRKLVEKALKESEEKHRNVIENANEAIFILQDNDFKYFNPKTCELCGFTPAELNSKSFLEIIHPDDQEMMIDKHIKRQRGEKTDDSYTFRITGKEGLIIWCEIKPVIINWEGNVATLCFISDITERKQAEDALLESEQKYKTAFKTNPDAVTISRLDGVYIDVNDGFTQLTGYSSAHVIGKSALDIDIWEKPEERHKFVTELRKKGFAQNTQTKLRCKDGSLVTTLMSASLIELNSEPHLLIISKDITDREKVRIALEESEKRYRMLFDRSSDAIFILETETGRYLDANKAGEKLTGRSTAELKKLTTSDVSVSGAKNRLKKVSQIDEPIDLGEVVYVRPDKTERIALVIAVPFKEKMLFGIARDITERKRAEKALIKERDFVSAILRWIESIVVVVDLNGYVVSFNKAAEDCSGYQLEELRNKPFWDILVPQRDRRSVQEIIFNVKVKLISVENENYWLSKNGQERLIHWDNSILFGPDNDIEYILCTGQDITERKKAEDELKRAHADLESRVKERTIELAQSLASLKQTQEELVRSERLVALGNMVAGIAHEINTPLGIGVTETSFLNDKNAEIIEKFESETLTRPNFEKYLKLVSESTNSIFRNLTRSANLIKNFKQVAVDQTSLEKRVFNLKEYIEGVILSLGPEIKRTKHNIIVTCPEELIIDSYPGTYSQIITNLIMNSLIHGFEGIEKGEIEFDIKKESNTLLFKYCDNGVGIDKKILKQIFDPFFTTKRNRGGTGLGMNIVYNLVSQKLNGQIKCNSSLGKGTEFIIEVPLVLQETDSI